MSSRPLLRPGVSLLQQLPPTPPLRWPLHPLTRLLLTTKPQSTTHRERNDLFPPQPSHTPLDTVPTYPGLPTTQSALSSLASHLTQTANPIHHLAHDGQPRLTLTTPGSTGLRRPIARDTPRDDFGADFSPSCEPAKLSQNQPCFACSASFQDALPLMPTLPAMPMVPSRTGINSLPTTAQIPPRSRPIVAFRKGSAASVQLPYRRLALPAFSSCKRKRKGT